MKKIPAFFLIMVLVFGLFSGCGDVEGETRTQIVVFAAASLTETLTELGDIYMQEHPDVRIVFNFDSSGTLKTQIQEGAACDIFISAGQKQMDQLDLSAKGEMNTEGLDFVMSEHRCDLLENKVVLVVSDENLSKITSFSSLCDELKKGACLLAMGNSDVPVGQYSKKLLDYYGLSEEMLVSRGTVTYASNVKEIATQVKASAVDCGILYATDAFSAGLNVVDTATAEMCGRVIYPAALLNISSDPQTAAAFLDFLKTEPAAAIFESVGFTPIP